METDAIIDWLTFTIPTETIPDEIKEHTGEFYITGQGTKFYRSSSKSDLGALHLTHPLQGSYSTVILSGVALSAIRDNQLRDGELCRLVLEASGKPTRLDVALDVLGSDLRVQDVENAFYSGEMKTPAKSSERRTKFPSGADTLYIGSRTSERMLRCYDKSAEMGIVDGTAWIRLEIEIKKMKARASMSAIATIPQTRAVMNGIFRQFIDWDNDVYRNATDDNIQDIADVPRREHNTLLWLRTQVAPAAAKYQNNHEGVDIRAILNEWIGALLIDNGDNIH